MSEAREFLLVGLVLILGVSLSLVLRSYNLKKWPANPAKNAYFWLMLLACCAGLFYVALAPELTATATKVVAATDHELPLPPNDLGPTADDAWSSLEQELQQQYAGQKFAIFAEDLRNPTRQIKVAANREMATASVYKLFMAYSILQSVDAGLAWDSNLNGTTLEHCFDKMIIESDNDCAHAWGDTHGWQTVMTEAAAIGAHAELLKPSTTSTAGDIAKLLRQIYHSQILSFRSREKLFSVMKTQRFRQGIPSGVEDKIVADKVGFMDGVLADAGIVFGAKGDYILVILTEGYSWPAIAEATRLIDAAF